MRRLDITPPRSSTRRCFLPLLAAFALFLSGGTSLDAQRPTEPAPPPPEPPQREQGAYVIQRDVDLVVLHASVFNRRGQFVPGLSESNFKVFEDKVEQELAFFRQEDIPVSLGLVIDNSGSMREIRPQVNAAALTLVRSSNPDDDAFVVNFNDDYYLDTVNDFTSDINELREALERIDSRGSTALYDAVIGSLDHLKKGIKDKKVLVVVSDGADNASRRTLENAVAEAQRSDALIYGIGIFGSDMNRGEKRRAREALEELATATGGAVFFPEDVRDTEAICTQIAHDIRNQYTLAYYPTNTAKDGTFRSVRVEVTPPRGVGRLTVRTRSGYFATPPPPSGN